MKQRAKNTKSRASDAPLPARRRWLFRLFALVLLPLLVLGGVEVALRMAGYGYRTGFFETINVGEVYFPVKVLVNNEDFSRRFFPPQLARWPEPIMLPAEKPAGRFRIFVFGESAARGEPEPPYSAARYLEALLRERFPGTEFEVVNTAITAINSHVILPIARDCARRNGDLWIIYMGNNEMVGPFGAATVFGAKAPPLWSVRLGLAVQETRLGQLLMAAGRGLAGNKANASWGGMKMFLGNQIAPDDSRRETVYKSFTANLSDILRAGLGCGARIILSTVAVNLADCPPFASMPATNLPVADRAARDQLFAEGCAAETNGVFAKAAHRFERAVKLDPTFAELQFRFAECLLRQTNLSAAHQHFQLACDDDALPFRATSRINGVIRDVAGKFTGPNLALVDATTALDAGSPNGTAGRESFYEHVHFNFDGQYRLARAWADQVLKFLPATITNKTTANWAAQADCERDLGLTDWNRGAVVGAVIWRLDRPPLSGQINNARRKEMLRGEIHELGVRTTAAGPDAARNLYLAALKASPADHWLHENFAEFLEATRDLKEAAAQWQSVSVAMPRNPVAAYQVGRLLVRQARWAEAEVPLQRAVALRPGLTEGWFELGNANMGRENYAPALDDYGRAKKLEPRDAVYSAVMAKALARLNRHDEAVKLYHEAIELDSRVWETHFALADELAAGQDFAGAEAEYEIAIKLQPTHALAHLNAGVMLVRLGKFEDAVREFDETLRLEPGNQQAREYRARFAEGKN